MGVDAHKGVEQEDDEELVGHALSGLRCSQERVQGADDHLLRALDGRLLSTLLYEGQHRGRRGAQIGRTEGNQYTTRSRAKDAQL